MIPLATGNITTHANIHRYGMALHGKKLWHEKEDATAPARGHPTYTPSIAETRERMKRPIPGETVSCRPQGKKKRIDNARENIIDVDAESK